MAELVENCPRCGAQRVTFDLLGAKIVGLQYNWKHTYEAFCVCRHCGRSTVFVLSDRDIGAARAINAAGITKLPGSINYLVETERYISVRDALSIQPPNHVPEIVCAVFTEGATCLSVGCFNAAAAMFRLCVDLASKEALPEKDENGLNQKIRRNLGLRLPWLFDRGILPGALRDLSHCIKEDGNDGAHEGTLTKEDAEDLLDFTTALLERLYTEPERLRLAKERRNARRTAQPADIQ